MKTILLILVGVVVYLLGKKDGYLDGECSKAREFRKYGESRGFWI